MTKQDLIAGIVAGKYRARIGEKISIAEELRRQSRFQLDLEDVYGVDIETVIRAWYEKRDEGLMAVLEMVEAHG